MEKRNENREKKNKEKRMNRLSPEERLNSRLLYTPEIITWLDYTNSTDE